MALPTKNYGDIAFDVGGGQTLRLEKAMVPGEGFISAEQGQYLTQGAVRVLGTELFRNVRKEFIAGGHDKTGAVLNQMEVQMGAMSVRISMRGGATFVEGGFPAHGISVRNAQALHWNTGGDQFAKYVWNPGYEGDPFVERAMKELPLDTVLTNIAKDVFTKIGGKLEQISGEQISWQDTTDTAVASSVDNIDIGNQSA